MTALDAKKDPRLVGPLCRRWGLMLFLYLPILARAQFIVPDTNLVESLEQIVPNAMSGNMLDTLHPDVIGLVTLYLDNDGINDMDGIQYFPSVESLHIGSNDISSLPSLPPNLIYLYCHSSDLTALPDLPASLQEIDCGGNNLTGLPPLPSALKELDCWNNQITILPALPSSLNILNCGSNLLSSLPPLPDSLVLLWAGNNPLTSLPQLPSSLRDLRCGYSLLTTLPPLPDSLSILKCYSANITSLPALPPELITLDCFGNELTGLPALPNKLRSLDCDTNMISVLPPLPDSLVSLHCDNNQLTSLPDLPNNLGALFCAYNVLTTLPALSDSLRSLNCRFNELSTLPSLPDSLYSLICSNNELVCLPPLPSELEYLYCAYNQITCLPNIPPSLYAPWAPLVVCNVATSPCPLLQEAITGMVFTDTNGNGILDTGDLPFPNAVVTANPGTHLTAADINGEFVLPISPGTFTLNGTPLQYHMLTTTPEVIDLAPLEVDSLNLIGYQPIPGVYDLVVDATASSLVSGFNSQLWLHVSNVGTESSPAAITLDLGPDLIWVSSSLPPLTQAGAIATWQPTLAPGEEWSATVTVHTPFSVPLGTQITLSLSAFPSMPDTTPGNNVITAGWGLLGPLDPNDKQVMPETLPPEEVALGAELEYTIRFQNTGTYHASHIVITDTLSTDLRWNTMRLIASSHPCIWYLDSNVLHFIFDPIMLPDSTTDEPGSHGFVKFGMAVEPSLPLDASIHNVANIFFDFNEPVITAPAVFTVEIPQGVHGSNDAGVMLSPNPTSGYILVQLDHTPSNAMAIVRDALGRIVLEKAIRDQRTSLLLRESGLYLVELHDANGRMASKRVVVE